MDAYSAPSDGVRPPMDFGGPAPDRGDAPPPCFDARWARPFILGAVLGSALGDAVGLQAEGHDPQAVAERLPRGIAYPSEAAYKGFPPNAWTDVTEQMILAMRTLSAYFAEETDDPAADLATRLAAWYKTGVSTLDGQPAGGGPRPASGPGPKRPPQFTHEGPRPPKRAPADTTTRAIAMADFVRAPRDSSRLIIGPKADNAALYRGLACAFTAAPGQWAQVLSETTHADERCTASAAMLSLLVSELARAAATPGPESAGARLANLAREPIAAGRGLISTDARRSEYVRRLSDSSSLSKLGLGDRDDQNYTLKTLAAAMWAFRQLIRTPAPDRGPELFRRTITSLAGQGGSACANCAVAGSVLGASLGLAGIPVDWLDALPYSAELVAEVDAFIAAAAPTW